MDLLQAIHEIMEMVVYMLYLIHMNHLEDEQNESVPGKVPVEHDEDEGKEKLLTY
jgi:hypothetical protein